MAGKEKKKIAATKGILLKIKLFMGHIIFENFNLN